MDLHDKVGGDKGRSRRDWRDLMMEVWRDPREGDVWREQREGDGHEWGGSAAMCQRLERRAMVVAVLRCGEGGEGNGLTDSSLWIVNPYERLTITDSQSVREFVCF